MDWLKLYKLLLLGGVALLITSIFFTTQTFLLLFSTGLLTILFSIYETHNIKKALTTTPQTTQQPPPPTVHKHFTPPWKKPTAPPPTIDTTLLPHPPSTPQPPTLPSDVRIITPPPPTDTNAHHHLLTDYVHHALRAKTPRATIHHEALEKHWPEDLVQQTITDVFTHYKKTHLILALTALLLVIIASITLSKLGAFLPPYWIKLLPYASPLFYIGATAILAAASLFFITNIRKALKQQKILTSAEEERTVADIKATLQQTTSGYETDLDKLYRIIQDKGKITIPEIAKAFTIKKEEAEEWGKILQDQDLATLHYPTVGDPELLWKKSKNTPSP